jgi:hypothetical protein
MAPRDGVRVGSTRILGGGSAPMSGGGVPPAVPAPAPPVPWYEQGGIFSGGVPNASWTGGGWADALSNAASAQSGRYIPGLPNYQNIAPQATATPFGGARGTSGGKGTGQQSSQITEAEYTAMLANQYGLGGGGGGGGRPDFSGYRNALMGQADELNARIQAMYNQLAEQAGANVGRIQDIYGGAQTGVGDIYDSATGNIQDAFGSSQQQAADQMARLGIEAAAPAVIDPMALSQAQAVSGLETGRAGGLAALERYGSTAGDFGSQMAQVAQQQGTEMNAAILASLQNRLAETLAAEQAGGGGGGGGGRAPSLRDQMAFTDWASEQYRRNVLGEVPLNERQFAFQQAESILRNSRSYEDAFIRLTTTPKPGSNTPWSPEEAEATIRYAQQTFAPNFGPNF